MNIAILGLGTVGSGVIKLIEENRDKIIRLTGEELNITHAYVNNVAKERGLDLKDIVVTDDIELILNSPIDVVIEVMGGEVGTLSILEEFLRKGIHVVTANKDLLAVNIENLTNLANKHKAMLFYEASVAGGIPIIRSIEHSLNSNKLTEVLGILNGTSNFILSKMTLEGWSYEQALAEAQELGYAEADPTNDVEGLDAQRKIALLSRLAYDTVVNLQEVTASGISSVEVADLETAKQAGLVMKLIGKSAYDDDLRQLSISVQPVFLPSTHQLANVHNAMNAVFVKGNGIGEAMFYGPGAGSLETASAVVSDVMHLAGIKAGAATRENFTPFGAAEVVVDTAAASYYVRFEVGAAPVITKEGLVLHPLETEAGNVAITSPLVQEDFAAFSQVNELLAAYPIEGETW